MGLAARRLPVNLVQKKSAGKGVKKHQIISLFAGCGGFDLGFLGGFKSRGKVCGKLPFEVVWANDISTAACKTYRQNFTHDIQCADVANIDISSLPKADVVLGGFPCQDFSVAGKRQGFKTERGLLYRFMVKCVRHCRPRVFVAENVKGLLSIPHALDTIKRDFEAVGYDVQWRVLNAADYGVPQNRQRVLIIGVKDGVFRWPEPLPRQITAQQAIKDLESQEWDENSSHIWSKAKRTNGQGQKPIKANEPSITIRAEHHGNIEYHYKLERRLSLREAARLQSFPDKFQLVSNMSESYRQIGNAVPPVLAWHIAKSVLAVLNDGQ